MDFLAFTETPFGKVDATAFLSFLACAWLVLKILSDGHGTLAKLTGKEPLGQPGNPLLTRKDERAPTWAEIGALEKRVQVCEEQIKAAMTKAGEDYRKMAEEGEKRASRLMHALTESSGKQHARIDQILAAVSRLEGTVETMIRNKTNP